MTLDVSEAPTIVHERRIDSPFDSIRRICIAWMKERRLKPRPPAIRRSFTPENGLR